MSSNVYNNHKENRDETDFNKEALISDKEKRQLGNERPRGEQHYEEAANVQNMKDSGNNTDKNERGNLKLVNNSINISQSNNDLIEQKLRALEEIPIFYWGKDAVYIYLASLNLEEVAKNLHEMDIDGYDLCTLLNKDGYNHLFNESFYLNLHQKNMHFRHLCEPKPNTSDQH